MNKTLVINIAISESLKEDEIMDQIKSIKGVESICVIKNFKEETQMASRSPAEIKDLVKEKGFHMWEIADRLNIHESTLCKWFRKPLTKKQEELILSATKR